MPHLALFRYIALAYGCGVPAWAGTVAGWTRPTLTIAVQTDQVIPAASIRSMEAEVRRILQPVAVVQWRFLADSRSVSGESFETVAVSHFTGSCEIGGDNGREAKTVLGETTSSSRDLQPFFQVDCGAVRALLMQQMAGENTPRLELALGTGLGRVVAHEIYHVLLNTRQHSGTGIAKATFAPGDLFVGPLRFEPEQMSRLAAVLARRSGAETGSTPNAISLVPSSLLPGSRETNLSLAEPETLDSIPGSFSY